MNEMKTAIIYDGACGFCAKNLKWIRRLDWLKKFETLPFQDDAVYTRFPQLKREECEKAMHAVLPNQSTFAGAEAFREVFLRMPLTCPLGLILCVPPVMWVAQRCYRVVAAHRHSLGESCEVRLHEDKKPDKPRMDANRRE